MARRWIKLWVNESLRGTIRFDFTPAQRGVWYDLLALAGDCRQEGLISPGKGVTFPLKFIANQLNIPLILLKKTLEICEKSGRVDRNSEGIYIRNWAKYQSEYERQKPFRAQKPPNSDNKVTSKVTTSVTEKLPVEVEGDIEVEVEEEKKEKLPPENTLPEGTKEPDNNATLIWQQALTELKKQINKPNYETWLADSHGLSYSGNGRFIVQVPSAYIAEYLLKHQQFVIEKTLTALLHREVSCEFVPQ